jgi:hypothetical protein
MSNRIKNTNQLASNAQCHHATWMLSLSTDEVPAARILGNVGKDEMNGNVIMLSVACLLTYLKVYSFISEEFVVKVVFNLLHIRCNIYRIKQFFGEITSCHAETCLR